MVIKTISVPRLGGLLFLVVTGAAVALYATRPAAAVGEYCGFKVGRDAGELAPLDQATGDRIGMFERWQDGSVQLTTYGGWAPKVTHCLIRKGFRAELGKIKAYDGPAVAHRAPSAPAVTEGDII